MRTKRKTELYVREYKIYTVDKKRKIRENDQKKETDNFMKQKVRISFRTFCL